MDIGTGLIICMYDKHKTTNKHPIKIPVKKAYAKLPYYFNMLYLNGLWHDI